MRCRRGGVVADVGEDRAALALGDEDDPSPDLTLNATNTDGLYVHLNTTTAEGANAHTVSAGILDPDCEGDDCQCILIGTSDVLTFPASVSIITLEGDLPIVP